MSTHRIGFADEWWLELVLDGEPVTSRNVYVGAAVRRNSKWDESWGCTELHPPFASAGMVIGFTKDDCTNVGDIDEEFESLARVQWDGSDPASTSQAYRIGFADEFWLEHC